jgi:hypothetical protein
VDGTRVFPKRFEKSLVRLKDVMPSSRLNDTFYSQEQVCEVIAFASVFGCLELSNFTFLHRQPCL